MSAEQATSEAKGQPRWDYLLVEYVDEESGHIKLINRNSENDLLQAVGSEINVLREQPERKRPEVEKIVAREKSHRPRSGREKADIRRQLTSKEDEERYAKLRVLKGNTLGVVKVDRINNEIVGVKPFKTKQREWWKKVLGDEELTTMATENPERLERIQSAIGLREKASNDGTMSQASIDFLDFVNRAEEEDPGSLPHIIRLVKTQQR